MAIKGLACTVKLRGALAMSKSSGSKSCGRDHSKQCNKVAVKMYTMVRLSPMPGHCGHPVPNCNNSMWCPEHPNVNAFQETFQVWTPRDPPKCLGLALWPPHSQAWMSLLVCHTQTLCKHIGSHGGIVEGWLGVGKTLPCRWLVSTEGWESLPHALSGTCLQPCEVLLMLCSSQLGCGCTLLLPTPLLQWLSLCLLL